MRLLLTFVIVLKLFSVASAAESEERVISPDERFAVVTIVSTKDEREVKSYVIRVRATGQTLATCPDDERFESGPKQVLWSPDSRFVAVSTHTSAHGDFPDLWEITASAARLLEIDFSKEDGDIYVTPKRWLSPLNLKCDVFGRSSSAHRELHPDETYVGYSLTIHIDQRSHETKISRTKPGYGHPK